MPVVQEILENGLLGEKSKIDEERDPRLGEDWRGVNDTASSHTIQTKCREEKLKDDDVTCLLAGFLTCNK